MDLQNLGPRTLLTAFVAGFAHAIAGAVVAEQLFAGGLPVGLLGTYVALGLFLVGGTVTVLWAEYDLFTPGLVVVVLFVVAAAGSWSTVSSPAVAVGPTPFGWYELGWFVVLALALAAGAVENRVREDSAGTTRTGSGAVRNEE
jgi:hypothetical protein